MEGDREVSLYAWNIIYEIHENSIHYINKFKNNFKKLLLSLTCQYLHQTLECTSLTAKTYMTLENNKLYF